MPQNLGPEPDGQYVIVFTRATTKARPLRSRPAAEHAESLNRAIETMLLGNPFVRSWQWKARAERRRCGRGR
jgi:hypothetical protein